MTDFEAVYARHFDGVYRYVYSLCRDEHTAEEITQEAFYRAMTHMDRFDGKCRLYVWLCQIAKNVYFTHAKRQKRYGEPEEAQAQPGFEEQLLERETAWEVHKLLHQLDEPYREVFSLRVLGELSFSQIGQLFGKSDSWARVVFFRAKTELRRRADEKQL